MQISVSSTLTVFHDGQFWVGLAEHIEDGRYSVARIVFGAEPSNEEILHFITGKWAKLSFFGDDPTEASKPAKNPKRRAREASRALKQPAMGTKAQQALASQAGCNETGVGPRKKPAPRGRGGGAFRAAEAETQAEASRALIAMCSKANHIQQRCRFHLKPTPLSIAPLVNNQSPSRSEGPPFLHELGDVGMDDAIALLDGVTSRK